jgi:hypothetical protein
MNALVVIAGESFRDGGRLSRETATSESYKTQKEATDSHINFIKHLESSHDIKVEVTLSSYHTKYASELVRWYDSSVNVVNRIFTQKLVEETNQHTTEYNRNYKTAIKKSLSNKANYDFIFLFRFDLLLKDYLFEIFDPNWNTIRFPATWHWKPHLKTGKFECGFTYPVVVDAMMFIPKRLFHTIFEFHLDLKAWGELICNKKLGVGYEDLDVMINTMHRPNTEHQWNPLFKMISRPEKPESLYARKEFDKWKSDSKK